MLEIAWSKPGSPKAVLHLCLKRVSAFGQLQKTHPLRGISDVLETRYFRSETTNQSARTRKTGLPMTYL